MNPGLQWVLFSLGVCLLYLEPFCCHHHRKDQGLTSTREEQKLMLVQLDDRKLEHVQHHLVKVLGENDFKFSKIDVVSKSMARAVAAISQYQKANLRKFYKGRKYKPLEQWPKTHGWRHRQNDHKDSLRPKTINKRNKMLCFTQGFTVGA